MPNLKEVSDAASAANIYVDRLIIFLEGQSDQEIFERLFPNKESEILFRTPDIPLGDTPGQPAKGYLAVINRVKQERTDRPLDPDRVIGFVDRDIFLAREEWDTLFEQNDQKYRDASQLGDGVIPLLYWEIENYLVDPRVISIVLADLKKKNDGIKEKIHTAIDRSMYLNAANCVAHSHRAQAIAHGIVLNKCAEEKFEALIKQQVKKLLGKAFLDNQFESFYKRFVKFLEGLDPNDRHERAMRIVSGKTLITYIRHHSQIHEEIEFLLAKETRNSKKIHEHLVGDIEERLASFP